MDTGSESMFDAYVQIFAKFLIKGGDNTSTYAHVGIKCCVKQSVIFFLSFLLCHFVLLTVTIKGTVLIISRMKGTRKTCSQTFPWKQKNMQNQKFSLFL